ncbi:MAG: type II CRISPR RNA-guided endonuclease Cas9, partial [Ferruginibacter sp.]
HHSKKENIYGEKIKDEKTGIDILSEPRIDSIKNPMFNKAMNIVRKLVNELIINDIIDEDTEVVIEVARELNDNNKRNAIDSYQRERENKLEKYREFLEEFKEKENRAINVQESIKAFELWTEQIFEETENEKGEKVINKNSNEILKEKEAVKRYELWREQKGQCIYTGKMISITQLFSNEIDIEHTIPRSLLPDNTMANQTVCYARYNRDVKHNRIPFDLENFDHDYNNYTAILPRLDAWIEKRDYYKEQYEKRRKPYGNEDPEKKNKRIQEKHFFKMKFDYWHDKVERFTADEIKESWARRQLTDTQMISKYAREFLKTYFKKVAVQKGSVTADFRKIYSFQEEDEIKNRNKHTHHAIDAAVLTLIPVNGSHRDSLLKKMYETYENEKKQFTDIPFSDFNSQSLIRDIENTTLIVNDENDKLLKKTYKNLRKRGKLQYLKDKNGDFVLDKNENKILLKAKGDTVRSSLYKDTFVAKIRDVERYEDNQPIRENGNWKYKQGKDEFIYAVRKPIKDVLSKIDDIIDPVIRERIRDQKNN